MQNSISDLFIRSSDSLLAAGACIDRNARGIALVVDDQQHLLGTITDGDLRRAILAKKSVDTPVKDLLATKAVSPYPKPVTALTGTGRDELLHLMHERVVRQVPLLDDEGRVVDVVTLDDLLPAGNLRLEAVIMAGGLGTRLRPLTDDVPKPMLPIGDRPLLEIIVAGLRAAGIRTVNVATHYKGEQIAEHLKDGQHLGVNIRYVQEDQPLGTAGALSLLEESEEPLLVINGDILTRVDFKAMLDFHNECDADLTVAVRQYEFRVPYGVIETDGVAVTGVSEKPVVRQFINAGIYLLNPQIRNVIPNGKHYDIPDLIQQLLKEGRSVVCFPIREYWLDIGESEQYDRANADMASGHF
ncbi:MAG TPA: alcohol dehydrogenase [Blastocatellia bacterium]|nr:alcohol dehydrogenase [Blastocatellia bacterium]